MAVGLPLKTTYANGDVYSASDVNDTNGTINLLQTSTLSSQAGKNGVINGGYDVWARGTSVSVSASSAPYTTDRWQANVGANQATTVSRQATGDTTNLPNIQYCARFQRNSGQTGTGSTYFTQSLESVNSIPFAGKAVTVSFYARRGSNYSATSNVLTAILASGTGTDQNINTGFTGQATTATSTVTLTTTWQRFTMTGTVASTATQLGVYFTFTPTGTASTNDYYEITGVQLELGSYATTFSRAGGTIQGELAACQRYYWRTTADSSNLGAKFCTGVPQSATTGYATIVNPVPMRVAPTSIDYTNLSFANYGLSQYAISAAALAGGSQSITSSFFQFTASSMTAGQFGWVCDNGSATCYIGFNAEL